MYIARPELEKKLRRAVNGTQHIIVFGDSGSGKTWLYKEYFKKADISFLAVDLSIAVTEGLDSAIFKSLPASKWRAVKRTVGAGGETKLYVMKAGGDVKTEYESVPEAPLDALISELNKKRNGRGFIVFDNFEQISRDENLLRDICSLIVRLDNPNFAQHNVRFLFVGVIADMKELISRFDFAGTIGNRLDEIPEVARLT